MKQLIKFSNFIILAVTLVIFFILHPENNFSFKFSSLLSGNEKKLYDISSNFKKSDTLFIAVKGFKKENLNTLKEIEKELLSLNQIKSIVNQNNTNYEKYKEKYNFYLNNFNYNKSDEVNIKDKLLTSYNNLLNSTLYFNIDKEDPLSLIKKGKIQKNFTFKNGKIVLNDYGYLSILSLDAINDEKSKIDLYTKIQNIVVKYDKVKTFTPLYYYVENSKKIQSDVQTIIYLSVIILSILYLVLLRNVYLFINVLTTLVSSVLLSEIFISFIFQEISIIALAFSIAVTSVSIDYMFHHYLHNYYDTNNGFNKSVFIGYMTTVLSFVLISFIDFPLIQQISLFSAISLTIAYIHFAFIYPYINIKYVKPYKLNRSKNAFKLNGIIISIITLIIIFTSVTQLKFDFNMKNLDYQNIDRMDDEYFFRSKLKQKDTTPILISATSIEKLITNAKQIKSIDAQARIKFASLLSKDEFLVKKEFLEKFGFEDLKKELTSISLEIGFKKDYFLNTYSLEKLFPTFPKYTLDVLNDMKLNIIYDGKMYSTYGVINNAKLNEIEKLNFVSLLGIKHIFEKSLSRVYDDLMIFGTFTILFIVFILFFTVKKRFLQALNYILVPVSLVLLYGVFIPLNIMHIFMLFIIIALGIDYGIYMSEEKVSSQTNLSIIYSLISTFAGFGILVFSEINSLYSVSIVTIIGIIGILFLLFFQKLLKIKEY